MSHVCCFLRLYEGTGSKASRSFAISFHSSSMDYQYCSSSSAEITSAFVAVVPSLAKVMVISSLDSTL